MCARIWSVLKKSWVDKLIATIAVLPFAYDFYFMVKDSMLSPNFPVLVYLVDSGLIILTMLLRRDPVRITTNPAFWALTLVSTYWFSLGPFVATNGAPIAPTWMIYILVVASIFLFIWARLSLGRNIGFVPAQRELVISGAYRWVRHPIYLAVFVDLFGSLLQNFSPGNLIFVSFGIFWMLLKSLAEEQFLMQDTRYVEYMNRVRWRWIPGVT